MDVYVGAQFEITKRGTFSPYTDRRGEIITIVSCDGPDVRWNVSWWDTEECNYYDATTHRTFNNLAEELGLIPVVEEMSWEV